MAFSPDGTRLASACYDEAAKVHIPKLFDAQTGEELFACKGGQPWPYTVAISPDGKRLASAYDKGVKVWDLQTGDELIDFVGPMGSMPGLEFNADGSRFALASKEGPVRIYDVATQEKPPTFGGVGGRGQKVVSPDGERVATITADRMTRERMIKIWNARTGQELLSISESQSPGHRAFVLAFSPDGKRLAAGFGIVDPMQIGRAAGSGGPRYVAGEVKVWDAQTGRELLTFKGHTSAVASLAFSPDGSRVVSSSSWPNSGKQVSDREPGEVKVWDAATGQGLLDLKGHKRFVDRVAYSPDGNRLATFSRDRTLKVWDAKSGRELFSLPMEATFVGGVAFSPDGKLLAGTMQPFDSNIGQIKLFSVETGEELLTLRGHSGSATLIAFSPDGRRLASGGGGVSEMKLWDIHTGEELLTIENAIDGVSFSSDGNRLFTTAPTGLKIFDATPLAEKP